MKKISAVDLCRTLQTGNKIEIEKAITVSVGDTVKEQRAIKIERTEKYPEKLNFIKIGIIGVILYIGYRIIK